MWHPVFQIKSNIDGSGVQRGLQFALRASSKTWLALASESSHLSFFGALLQAVLLCPADTLASFIL